MQAMLRSIGLAALAMCLSASVMAAKTVVIDVRTSAEFAESHIPGALNIEHERIAAQIAAAGVAKDDKVILYCRSGRRSAIAQQSLQKQGYRIVLNYGALEDARRRLAADK